MEKNNLMPTFIGVGGHKCASTWISECLRAHPEVYMSVPKEIHYFSGKWQNSLEWYLSHFENSIGYNAVGEFSATYLQNSEIPERIVNELGEVKIIISIRNPIERFISHYKHLYRNGSVKSNKLTKENFDSITKVQPSLLERGRYSSYIEKYIEYFGASRVHIMFKEDLDVTPKEEIKKLYNFLEIDGDFTPSILEKKVSTGIVPRFYFLEFIRVKSFRFLNKVAPKLIVLIRKIRIMELYRRLNNNSANLKVDKEVKEFLIQYYIDDIRSLEKKLNVDLNHWKSFQ